MLLLDEPFGALDAKIREELRRTIRQVQRELKITTVLVTHDQEEAFALADRIGVMNLGRLLESGRPDELYARPATRFVATFLGAANLLLARQTEQGIRFGATPVNARRVEKLEGGREHEVVAVLRPEEVELAPTRDNLRTNYHRERRRRRAGVHRRARTHARAHGRMAPPMRTSRRQHDDGSAHCRGARRHAHSARAARVPGGARSVGRDRRAAHSRAADAAVELHRVCATKPRLPSDLSQHPFLVELASRMKTRIAKRSRSPLLATCAGAGAVAPVSGVAVIAAQPEGRGADRVAVAERRGRSAGAAGAGRLAAARVDSLGR